MDIQQTAEDPGTDAPILLLGLVLHAQQYVLVQDPCRHSHNPESILLVEHEKSGQNRINTEHIL